MSKERSILGGVAEYFPASEAVPKERIRELVEKIEAEERAYVVMLQSDYPRALRWCLAKIRELLET